MASEPQPALSECVYAPHTCAELRVIPCDWCIVAESDSRFTNLETAPKSPLAEEAVHSVALDGDTVHFTTAQWGIVENIMDSRDMYEVALYRIASMPTEPRPDGSFNYCRSAIIEIARKTLGNDYEW